MKKIFILFLLPILVGCANNLTQDVGAVDYASDGITHNLTVHLAVEEFGQGSGTSEYEIRKAILACQSRPGPMMNNGEQKPSSPDSWCGVEALNTPIRTENKRADLLFLLEPSPSVSSAEFSDDEFAYDTPMLFLDIDGMTSSVNTVDIENDEWSASATSKHNLTVEVSFDNSITGQVIEEARLNCSEIPKYDYNGEIVGYLSPSSPDSWCGIQADNSPLVINGRSIELYFDVDPSPLEVEFDPEPSPAYDSPMLYLKINGNSYVVGTENSEQNLWKTTITLR